MVRVLQGRDARSVRALISDPRALERGFHDVTIVDMEDTAEPAGSEADKDKDKDKNIYSIHSIVITYMYSKI